MTVWIQYILQRPPAKHKTGPTLESTANTLTEIAEWIVELQFGQRLTTGSACMQMARDLLGSVPYRASELVLDMFLLRTSSVIHADKVQSIVLHLYDAQFTPLDTGLNIITDIAEFFECRTT